MTAVLESGAEPTDLAGASGPRLSLREIEVLRAWFASDSKAAVADRLFISVATVNTHLARIRQKYAAVGRGASTKAALVARALQDGHVGIAEL